MCALPAKLLNRVHLALELHKCSDAELILMQAVPGARDTTALFEDLCDRADELGKVGDYEQAGSLYQLAIELCEECMPDGHPEIFSATRKLGLILIRLQRDSELHQMIERLQPLLLRTARALGASQHGDADIDFAADDFGGEAVD